VEYKTGFEKDKYMDRKLIRIPKREEQKMENEKKSSGDRRILISIGRQTGSGGREIGRLLSAELGISYYDKEILERAAKESGLSKELFEYHDEKPTTSFLYSLVMDSSPYGYPASLGQMPIDHKLFLAQYNTIKKIASEESSVFVGRCADYALEDQPELLSVFIRGNFTDRVRRLMKEYSVNETAAKEMILKTDKKRSSYYSYYSNKKWGEVFSYDLCLNSSMFGIDGCVSLIKAALEEKEKEIRG